MLERKRANFGVGGDLGLLSDKEPSDVDDFDAEVHRSKVLSDVLLKKSGSSENVEVKVVRKFYG
jgi:hypothetical protein